MNNDSAIDAVRQALLHFSGEVISLLIGEPYYSPSGALREAVAKAAAEGCNRYSETAGSFRLRELICESETKRGLAIEPANVVIGNGSKSLLYGLFSLLGESGAIVPTPAYPAMLIQPRMLGQRLQLISTADNGFRLTADMLKSQEASGGCLVIGNPANPTGLTCKVHEQRALVEWCRNQGVRLIADEVYADLVYGNEFSSFLTADHGFEAVVSVRSFSKSHGICGWRLGYAICDADSAARLARWQYSALNPPSTLIQRAIELSYYANEAESLEHRRYFAETAKILAAVLTDMNMEFVRPEGGFYLFVDVTPFITAGAVSGSTEFCSRLASSEGVVLWPGEDFGQPGWVRIAFGAVEPDRREELVADLAVRLHRYTNALWKRS